MFRNVWVFALRGAAGFLAGGTLSLVMVWMRTSSGRGPGTLAALAVYFASGAIGAIVLLYGRIDSEAVIRTAFGFGLGSIIALFCALFVMLSLQGGGKPDVTWGAVGFGIAYAIGGGIGALFLAPRYALWGAAAFGFAAAWAGFSLFWLMGTTQSPAFARILGITFYLLPHAMGGGLFGACVGLFGEFE